MSMSYDDECTESQTQQYSDESSQDQLKSINSSVIRRGPLRVALVERKNELDVEKPGERATKRFRHRVDKKVQDGVPMSESGSGFAESVAVSPCATKSRKLKPTQRIKRQTADDWRELSEDDQEDFVKPPEAKNEAPQEPAPKRQNKGKLLTSSQAAGVIIDILEQRVEHNAMCQRIWLAVPAPAPAQHATASEYPFGGDMSQANKPVSTHYDADLLPDQSQHWLSADQMDNLLLVVD